jgi:hypothetical protein
VGFAERLGLRRSALAQPDREDDHRSWSVWIGPAGFLAGMSFTVALAGLARPLLIALGADRDGPTIVAASVAIQGAVLIVAFFLAFVVLLVVN